MALRIGLVPTARYGIAFSAAIFVESIMLDESAVSYGPSLPSDEIQRPIRKIRTCQAEKATLLLGNRRSVTTITRAKAVLRGNALSRCRPEAESRAAHFMAHTSKVYTGAEAREERAKAESGQFPSTFCDPRDLNNSSPSIQLMLSQART